MKYNCTVCNYETDDFSNYNKHKSTKKHINKSALTNKNSILSRNLAELSPNLAELSPSTGSVKVQKQTDKFKCSDCDATFSHESSLSRHKKRCKKFNKDDIAEEYEMKIKLLEAENKLLLQQKIDDLSKQLEESKEREKERVKENKNDKEKIFAISEASVKIGQAGVKTAESSMSALNYLIKNYNDAPPIHKFSNFKLLSVGNEKFTLPEIVIHYYKKGKTQELAKYVGDKILLDYKKEDPSQQSSWVSDLSRFSYLIKEKNVKGSSWNKDAKGIRAGKSMIKPVLDHIESKLIKYNSDIAKKFAENNNTLTRQEREELVAQQELAVTIAKLIQSGELLTATIKYVSPKLQLVRTDEIKTKGKIKAIKHIEEVNDDDEEINEVD